MPFPPPFIVLSSFPFSRKFFPPFSGRQATFRGSTFFLSPLTPPFLFFFGPPFSVASASFLNAGPNLLSAYTTFSSTFLLRFQVFFSYQTHLFSDSKARSFPGKKAPPLFPLSFPPLPLPFPSTGFLFSSPERVMTGPIVRKHPFVSLFTNGPPPFVHSPRPTLPLPFWMTVVIPPLCSMRFLPF